MRALRSLCLCLLAALPLSGCSGAEEPQGEAAADGPRDTLVIGAMAATKDLLSPVATSATDSMIMARMGLSLLDSDFDCGLRWKPALAESWSWSDDGLTLKMTLRADRKWSDGTPVTASDVKMLFDLVGDPAVASPRLPYLAQLSPDARPRVIDPTHIEFEFTKRGDPDIMLASVASLTVVPAHALAAPGIDRGSLRSHPLNVSAPLAAGPFAVTSWEKASRLVLEPNPNWSGPPPKLRRVIVKVIPEYATRLLELQNGSIDFMEGVQVVDADSLVKDHPEIKLVRRGLRNEDYIVWNGRDPADWQAQAASGERPEPAKVKAHALFGDVRTRRALTQALDIDQMMRAVLASPATGEVYGKRAIGTITPELCSAYAAEVQPLPFDPVAARSLFAEAGWSDTNNDGVLDRDGVPFRFTMLTNAGNPRRAKVVVIVQSMLKEVGVDMQIETLETGVMFERLRKKDFDASLAGYSSALWADPSTNWSAESEFNFAGWQTKKGTELLARGLAAPNKAGAEKAWREFQAELYADQPHTFLWWLDDIVAIHSRFQNVHIDLASATTRLEEWSVPPEAVKYAR